MATNKSWIRIRNRNDPVFLSGLENFIETAKNHLDGDDKTYCPCKKCGNSYRHNLTLIKAHIRDKGFDQSYDTWIYHGEEFPDSPIVDALLGRPVAPTQEMFDVLDDVMAEHNINEDNIDEDELNKMQMEAGDDNPMDEVGCLKRALGERSGWERGIGRKVKRPSSNVASVYEPTPSQWDIMQQQLKELTARLDRMDKNKGQTNKDVETQDMDVDNEDTDVEDEGSD